MTAQEFVAFDVAGEEFRGPGAGNTYIAKKPAHFEQPITTDSTIDGRDVAVDGALAASAIQPGDDVSELTNDMLASEIEAEAGVENTKIMTPLRVAQAISEQDLSVQDNLVAVLPPTVQDDSGFGYSARSLWVDTVLNKAYICVDASINTAVWIEITVVANDLHVIAVSGDSDDLTEGIINLLLTVAERALIASAVQPADIGSPYGLISIQSGAAAESTVDATPRKIEAWNQNGLTSGVTADHTSNDLTIDNAGTYILSASISFSGTANKTYILEFYKNGVATGYAIERLLGAGGDIGAVPIHGIVNFAENDTLEIYQHSTDGGTALTITEGQLVIQRAGA